MIDLPAIRARLEKASPGPWTHNGDEEGAGNILCDEKYGAGFYGNDGKPMGLIAQIDNSEYIIYEDIKQGLANGDFIAHARQDIPALLDEIERLQKIIGEHEFTCPDCGCHWFTTSNRYDVDLRQHIPPEKWMRRCKNDRCGWEGPCK